MNTKSFAVYADWTFDLTDKLKLDVGARYTDEDKHAIAVNRFYTEPEFKRPSGVIAANFDKTINFKNVSPKVSLDYQITPDIMVYGLASRGFKSGGYNIRANTTAVPRSGEPFDDEQVDSYEIGSKMAFFDQRLFLNLAAFHNIYKDIQLSVFTAFDSNGNGSESFFGDFTNAGKGTVNGAEVEYQWLPNEHWLISGNLAWLDAKYDEFITSGRERRRLDQRFTNAPEFSGALNVEWRTPLANGGNLSARVGYSYQGEVWPTTDLSPAIKQDGYGLVGAGVIWKVNDSWQLLAAGQQSGRRGIPHHRLQHRRLRRADRLLRPAAPVLADRSLRLLISSYVWGREGNGGRKPAVAALCWFAKASRVGLIGMSAGQIRAGQNKSVPQPGNLSCVSSETARAEFLGGGAGQLGLAAALMFGTALYGERHPHASRAIGGTCIRCRSRCTALPGRSTARSPRPRVTAGRCRRRSSARSCSTRLPWLS